jgi:hypothetical protein
MFMTNLRFTVVSKCKDLASSRFEDKYRRQQPSEEIYDFDYME